MKENIKFLDSCRVCSNKKVSKILHFKDMPFTDEFIPRKNIGREFIYDIDIFLCDYCYTVQTQHDVDIDKYYIDYKYSVGQSSKALKFMDTLATKINNDFFLKEKKKSILEVGSSDGTQLKQFKKLGFDVLGAEPSAQLSNIANKRKIKTLNKLFSENVSKDFEANNQKFNIVLLTYTFDHLPEPGIFLKNCNKILKNENGFLIIEVHDLEQIYKKNEFCLFEHEHSIYLTKKSASRLLKKYNFEIIDFNFIGEDIRRANSLLFIAKKKKNIVECKTEMDESFKVFESKSFYNSFEKKIKNGINNLDKYISNRTSIGKKIAGYGAGGRGVMTLANMKNSSQLDFLIEKNPKSKKIYTPSSNLPVVSLDYLNENPIDEILVFSYGYMDEIKEELKTYGYQKNQIISFIDVMKEGKNV